MTIEEKKKKEWEELLTAFMPILSIDSILFFQLTLSRGQRRCELMNMIRGAEKESVWPCRQTRKPTSIVALRRKVGEFIVFHSGHIVSIVPVRIEAKGHTRCALFSSVHT